MRICTFYLGVYLPYGPFRYHLFGQPPYLSISGWWFQRFFIFTPKIGEMIQFDEHIFQMGWFNHQVDKYTVYLLYRHFQFAWWSLLGKDTSMYLVRWFSDDWQHHGRKRIIFASPGIRRQAGMYTPLPNEKKRPYKKWVFMGYNPQESLENTINTMGTRTLGVHPSLSLEGRMICFGLTLFQPTRGR